MYEKTSMNANIWPGIAIRPRSELADEVSSA
jgi:hypothetical protein